MKDKHKKPKEYSPYPCSKAQYRALVFDRRGRTHSAVIVALGKKAEVRSISDEDEILNEIRLNQYDLVFLDNDSLSGNIIDLLHILKISDPFLPIIVTSEFERAEVIVAVMRGGASDFLVHPISPVRICISCDKAIKIRDQRFEIAYHRRNQDIVYDFNDVIAFSPAMQRALKSLVEFAKVDANILISGEAGTGKSFLAGTVHFNSRRRERPFVEVNCSKIRLDLLESELFGHEKGAFPGADKQRIGRFEQANGGTIFLSQIGRMDLELQDNLIRVVEKKSFERVGGNKTINVDVRIIAATNRDLARQVDEGFFHRELYHKLSELAVSLPALRERPKCILPLAEALLQRRCLALHRELEGFTENARIKMQNYDWPGNIRQLANTIERAVILEDGMQVHAHNIVLPKIKRESREDSFEKLREQQKEISAHNSLARQEKELFTKVLEESLWVQKNAAKRLGISTRAMLYKIRELGIAHSHWKDQ
ncbi:MAG: sigma-54-dependent Fis family transcriptional regulator [Deltaproteobacteria bacterium]|nr:MAG: sigma-54-dependent Fis family transcriptional regulator [Deltaproteobacteria bacterium]